MNKLRHGDFVIRDRGGKWRAVTINILPFQNCVAIKNEHVNIYLGIPTISHILYYTIE